MKTSATLEETNLTCKCKYTSLQDPELEQKAKMKIVKFFFLFLLFYIFSTRAKSLVKLDQNCNCLR